MLQRTTALVATITAALLAAACSETTAPDSRQSSSFTAGIHGAHTSHFANTSFFHIGAGPDGPAFSIYSRKDTGSNYEGFLIYGLAEMPARGTYEIGLRGSAPIQLVYSRGVSDEGDGDFIAYAADRGTLVVTSATPERIEGTFTFEAAEYCKVSGGRNFEGPCVPPTEPVADVPRVTGTGSFSAISFDAIDDGEEIRRGTIKLYYQPIMVEAEQSAAGGPVRVRVDTFGNGCVSMGRTDVRIEGNVIIVEPFNTYSLQRACTDILKTIRHQVEVQPAEPGTYTVRVIGQQEPGDMTITVERTVQVR